MAAVLLWEHGCCFQYGGKRKISIRFLGSPPQWTPPSSFSRTLYDTPVYSTFLYEGYYFTLQLTSQAVLLLDAYAKASLSPPAELVVLFALKLQKTDTHEK